MEVIPGILEKDWNEIEKKLETVKSFASAASDAAKSVHVDIIDGKFAFASPSGGSNTTFLDPNPFAKYSQNLFLELHLMTGNPIEYLESFAKAGFKRFIGHVESLRQSADQAEFVAKAQLLGEVGLAIDGPTPLEAIKVPYEDLDCVLVMTIKAGQSGQKFNAEYLNKVEMLKQVQHDIKIEIDGGVNDQTIILAKNAGADRFIANSFLFNGHDPQGQFKILEAIVNR